MRSAIVGLMCILPIVFGACDAPEECRGTNVSYVRCIRPALTSNCSGGGCHGKVKPEANLDLETIGKIYDNIYKKVVSAGGKTYTMVIPEDPNNSYLMIKMRPNPPVGDRMPPYLRPFLSDSQMRMFDTWIQEGAKNDDPNYKPPPKDIKVKPPTVIPKDVVNVSFKTTIKPMYKMLCSTNGGCHHSSAKAANLDLDQEAWKATVNKKSLSGTYALVQPGKPLESLMYIKLLNERPSAAGSKMPPAGLHQPTEKEIAQLYVWILEGAKNN